MNSAVLIDWCVRLIDGMIENFVKKDAAYKSSIPIGHSSVLLFICFVEIPDIKI